MNKSRIKWWPQYLAAITGNYKPLAKEEIKFFHFNIYLIITMYCCYNDYTNQQGFNINVILVTLR